MWRIVLTCAITLCALTNAIAQKTPVQIQSEIGTLFPDNTVGAITPARLRQVTTDISNSYVSTFLPANKMIAGDGSGQATQITLGSGLTISGTALNCTLFTSVATGCVPLSGGGTSNYLRADGTWASPSANALANPTAQVGLIAVNGVASTGIRSDGAPALSQAIAPSWTGSHDFQNAINKFSNKDSGIEFGSLALSGSPFVDWHSSGNNIDYDVRLQASGGTAVAGNGLLGLIGTLSVAPPTLASNQAYLATQTATGSNSSGVTSPFNTNDYGLNYFQVVSDNVARPSSGANKFGAFLIYHKYGGSAMIGGRNSINVLSQLTATSSASNNDRNYQAGNFVWYSNANDTGGSGTEAGAGFALGGAAILDSGASNWLNLSFMEANVAVVGTATVKYKSMIQMSSLPQDAVQGSTYDCQLCSSNQPGAVGWKNSILVGNMNGAHPLSSTGKILATVGSATIGSGIDISSYTITNSAFKSPGFDVSGDGVLTLAQQTTPANPSAGSDKLYFKSDNNLYRLTSAGVESAIGGGGGTPGGSNTQVQFNSSGSFGGSANLTWVSPKLTIGVSGTLGQLAFGNATSGVLTIQPDTGALGTKTITLPNATDTLVGKATTDTFTNKTYVTNATGNAFTLAFPGTVSGVTSGGVPYFSSTTAIASSAILGSQQVVLGGGAGGAPNSSSALTWTGNVFNATSSTTFGPQFVFTNTASDSTAGFFILQKSRGGGDISNGDDLGAVIFKGFSNSAYNNSVAIASFADQAPSGSNVFGGICFKQVTAVGSQLCLGSKGHLHLNSSGTNISSVTGCGTSPTIRSGSTDIAGEITEGSSATGCVINFANAFSSVPFCTITSSVALSSLTVAVAVGNITLSHGNASGAKISYTCVAPTGP